MGISIICKGAKKAGDEIWIARYLLDRLTEQYGYYIEYHPKPIKGIGMDLVCMQTSQTLL